MNQRKLKTLEVRNIGRVEHEILHFGHLTRVEGENGAGKSMITFDALKIICLGDDFTEDMVREGEKFGSIKLTFTDGSWLERVRDRKKQKLLAVDAEGNVVIEAETVKDMVKELQKFTGFSYVELLKDSKENFQFTSIDDPQTYLLGGISYNSVLRKLSKVVGGTGAETAKAKLEAEVRTQVKEKDVHLKMAATLEKKVHEIWSQVDLNEIQDDSNELEALGGEYLEVQRLIEDTETLLEAEDKGLAFLAEIEEAFDAPAIQSEIQELQTLRANAQSLESLIVETAKVVAQRKALDKPFPELPADAEFESLRKLDLDYAKLAEGIDAVEVLLESEDRAYTRIERLTTDLEEIGAELVEARKRSSVCKECGQVLLEAAA